MRRIFTAHEEAYARRRKRTMLLHLAGRFAAKEAVIKALGGGALWKEIELPRRSGQGVAPKLSGRAARLLGKRRLTVSITHTDRAAAAVALVS